MGPPTTADFVPVTRGAVPTLDRYVVVARAGRGLRTHSPDPRRVPRPVTLVRGSIPLITAVVVEASSQRALPAGSCGGSPEMSPLDRGANREAGAGPTRCRGGQL